VLFFPDQRLTPDEHIAFGRLFGKLESHPNLSLGGERPSSSSCAPNSGAGAIADEWHSDLTCQEQPSLLAILHMVKCPPGRRRHDVGERVQGLRRAVARDEGLLRGALRAARRAPARQRRARWRSIPVVRVHPVTKKKSLFVNEHFTRRIVELSHQESEALLGFLGALDPEPALHGPLSLDARHDRDVGQPLHAAPRAERLRGRARDPARHGDGRPARARARAALGALHQVLQRGEPPRSAS
jgi:taurine dioxygenase